MPSPRSAAFRTRVVLSALMFACAIPASGQTTPTVRIGSDVKKTAGTVVSMQTGDVACYITLRDEMGSTFVEMADYEICGQKPSPVGKRVALGYSLTKVMSDACQGDPNCKLFRTVPLVSSLKTADERADGKAAVAVVPAGSTGTPAPHACAATAIRQAEKLLKFHDEADQPRPVSVGRTARVLGTVKSPAGAANFDVLEVEGAIYKSRYRLRMLYGQIPGACVLVGQEILEITNL